MPLSIYYCDHYPIPLPSGHKFPLSKYSKARERLTADARFALQPSPLAETRDLEQAHDAEYVHRILEGTLDPMAMRRIGFPWSEALVRRSLASVGGTLEAARRSLEVGIGGNLAGGTHHAFRAEGSGFCVFNDLAVAALCLRRDGLARRIAILDVDVHQGDGTASIFANDPEVLTISLHGENNFPFRKQQSRIDIGLPDGTGDDRFLQALEEVLPAIWDFRPDLLLYQSGVDALHADRLGRLSMTHAGLVGRDRLVFEAARSRDLPVTITLGGGYADPIELTVDAHVNTFVTAAAVWAGQQPLTTPVRL